MTTPFGFLADGLPAGRLVAVRRGVDGGQGREPLRLEPGPMRDLLAVDGLPFPDLPPRTRLRLGTAVVLEVGASGEAEIGEHEGGLVDATSGVRAGVCVLAGGMVGVGDRVVIEAIPVPLEDTLDLHPFRPDEVAAVVAEYLEQARAAGLGEVRIIHGRGRGVQRETVRRLIAASALVAAFGDAPPERGGWGATLVRLRGVSAGRLV